jgi:hypothetical protein
MLYRSPLIESLGYKNDTSRFSFRNPRKTVAMLGAPPKDLAGFFRAWQRAAAPFALAKRLPGWFPAISFTNLVCFRAVECSH